MPLRQAALLCCIILGPLRFALAEDYAAVNFSAKPGPHAVGLSVVEQYDCARNFESKVDQKTVSATQAERARPLQTLVWYPAQKRARSAMTMGDYVALMD